MHTLARLSDYLNELLGDGSQKNKAFGNQIENVSLAKDRNKDIVNDLVDEFQKKTE